MENPNRTTLIIDGNWLLMSRLGMMMGQFSKDLPPQYLEQAKSEIIEFVAQSINKIINFWGPCIDNIIMVQDGGSWRKQITKPQLYQDEYKGNRVPATEVAWDYVWDALKTICQSFHENHITCVTERGIEGDDWCWYWSRYLNHEGINCIIWSSDADLKQLVQKNTKTGAWTAWFNDRAGLVLHRCLEHTDMEVLMNFESVDPFVEDLISHSEKVNYINPDDIVMEKVICGDAGDNIHAVIRVPKTTKTGKVTTAKVSEKEWIGVRNELNICNIKDFQENKGLIIRRLKSLHRLHECTDKIEDLEELFDYNMTLVRLHKEQIPKAMQQAMNKHKDEYIVTNLDFLRNNYKVLVKQAPNVEELFEELPF